MKNNVKKFLLSTDNLHLPGIYLTYQNCRYLQQNGRYQFRKLFGYSIFFTTQRGESEPMDLPFLLPQSLLCRSHDLTLKLKMR
jgi:hypothetical protein